MKAGNMVGLVFLKDGTAYMGKIMFIEPGKKIVLKMNGGGLKTIIYHHVFNNWYDVADVRLHEPIHVDDNNDLKLRSDSRQVPQPPMFIENIPPAGESPPEASEEKPDSSRAGPEASSGDSGNSPEACTQKSQWGSLEVPPRRIS